MNPLVNIKQGFDCPVSVTVAITRPLVPFAGICNNLNCLFCITLCILTVLSNETI